MTRTVMKKVRKNVPKALKNYDEENLGENLIIAIKSLFNTKFGL